jgi:hypothetical protein
MNPALLSMASLAGAAVFPNDAAVDVFLYALARSTQATVVCVRQDGHDPASAVIRHLNQLNHALLPGSKCSMRMGPQDERMIETASGREAVMIEISNFVRVSPTEATVSVTYIEGPVNGFGYSVRFRLIENKWIMESEGNGWKS